MCICMSYASFKNRLLKVFFDRCQCGNCCCLQLVGKFSKVRWRYLLVIQFFATYLSMLLRENLLGSERHILHMFCMDFRISFRNHVHRTLSKHSGILSHAPSFPHNSPTCPRPCAYQMTRPTWEIFNQFSWELMKSYRHNFTFEFI